jgi:hypothetical protein
VMEAGAFMVFPVFMGWGVIAMFCAVSSVVWCR